MHVIENDFFEIHINEEAGCDIMACFVKKGEEEFPLMPDAREDDCELDQSSFIMAPYSNRVEDGKFIFRDKEYTLERGDEHSIHGDVRQRPWKVVDYSKTLLHCEFDGSSVDDLNWPWPFKVEAIFELQDDCFQSILTLKNLSDEDMPAGFGWHPYFSRALSSKDQEIRLKCELEGVYPDDNGNCIPSGRIRPLKDNENFEFESNLETDEFLDNCFYGYQGNGYLYWPGTGLRLKFDCSDTCKHVVIYTPLGKPHVAFEPVTNANNGVNLFAKGDETAGTVVLEPGSLLSAQFDMTALWD